MNMTALYISFGIIFGLFILALIALGVLLYFVYRQQKEFDESQGDVQGPKPMEFETEDVTIRVRSGELEAYETPLELLSEEEDLDVLQEDSVASERGVIDGVLINRSAKMTFQEKYDRLPSAKRELLDDFAVYFTSQPECGKQLRAHALSFRYKKGQVVRATIRRDEVHLSFVLLNPTLGRMVREERVNGVKMKPVEIRLLSENDLEIAKQAADLTIEYFRREDEYRLEKRKEARREIARHRREEAALSKS